MSATRELNFKPQHNFYPESPNDSSQSDASCKSNLNINLPNEFGSVSLRSKEFRSNINFALHLKNDHREYYKRYEHDELPVKESSFHNAKCAGKGDKISLTNSDLDKLEMKVFKNISQELQTEESSMSSLDSNIKFFKTTVQEIFDNFYSSMQDFELYKKRFHDILAKNREESIADMEDFIKDMIHHIMSSETTASNTSRKSTAISMLDVEDKKTYISSFSGVNSETDTFAGGVLEAYKNENYLTDSNVDENEAKIKRCSNKEEIFNIYSNGGSPYVQIKMTDRNLLSEINIKETDNNESRGIIASADNIKRLAAKKLELEQYVEQHQDNNISDVEIPVRVSYAKKNIHLNEDFARNDSFDANKSFMTKICDYLCRKLRKSSFG